MRGSGISYLCRGLCRPLDLGTDPSVSLEAPCLRVPAPQRGGSFSIPALLSSRGQLDWVRGRRMKTRMGEDEAGCVVITLPFLKGTSCIPANPVHFTLLELSFSYVVLTELGFFISLPFLLFQVIFTLCKCWVPQKCQLPHWSHFCSLLLPIILCRTNVHLLDLTWHLLCPYPVKEIWRYPSG